MILTEMSDYVTLEEMLSARDFRAEKQKDCLTTFQTVLICFTMNIAGPVKSSELICRGFDSGLLELLHELEEKRISVLYQEKRYAKTGPEAYLAVRASALRVKRLAVYLEQNHPLGRLFDIDVLTKDGRSVPRQRIDVPERTCLLCGENAKACGRSRRHSIQALQNKTDEILKTFYNTEKQKIC